MRTTSGKSLIYFSSRTHLSNVADKPARCRRADTLAKFHQTRGAEGNVLRVWRIGGLFISFEIKIARNLADMGIICIELNEREQGFIRWGYERSDCFFDNTVGMKHHLATKEYGRHIRDGCKLSGWHWTNMPQKQLRETGVQLGGETQHPATSRRSGCK